MQYSDKPAGMIYITQHGGLGDFETDLPGIDLTMVQRINNKIEKAVFEHGLSGQIYRHAALIRQPYRTTGN